MDPAQLRFNTDRLTVRPVEASDAAVVAQALGDEAVWEFMEPPRPPPSGELIGAFGKLEAMLSSDERPTNLCWVAHGREGGTCVATARTTLGDADEATDLTVLVARTFWGQGFGPELIEGIFSLVREVFGVRHLTGTIDHRNRRSARAAHAAAMVPLAIYRGQAQVWLASVDVDEYLARHHVMIDDAVSD